MGNIVVANPNQAKIISGPRGTRTIIGSSGFQWWCVEQTETLSLELMTLDIFSSQAETTKGVRVNVRSVAQIKVKAIEPPKEGDSNFKAPEYNMRSIHLAAQHFLGDSENTIRNALKKTMEGHQRQILGTLTVEEIYKDRAAFSQRILEHVNDDLGQMGYSIVSYTVTSIDDDGGYMQSLGQTQTSMVKREAAEGKARNEGEARKKVAQYHSEANIAEAESQRLSHVSRNKEKQIEAESDRDLRMKEAEFTKQVNKANAEALAAGKIESAIQKQAVVRETTQQSRIEREIQVEIASKEADRIQKVKQGTSLAELIEEENKAKAIKLQASAESQKIREIGKAKADATLSIGTAEAQVLKSKGLAESEVLSKKAAAFKQYGEAAILQMIVEKLPEIASSISKPLNNVDKMVFVSQEGNAGSMLTNDINRMLSAVPASVEALTGLDITNLLKKKVDGAGSSSKTKTVTL